MKTKNFLLSIFVFLLSAGVVLAQTSGQMETGKSLKKDQSNLYNEVFASYGIGSLYVFTSEVSHSYNYLYSGGTRSDLYSIGTFSVGFNRMVNRIVMVGFTASYFNINYTRDNINSGTSSGPHNAKFNDNVLSGIAKLTFNYINKPMVRVYSAVSMGISVILSNASTPGYNKETDKKILPGGQVTFMGARFGRTIGGFIEFGIGSNSIISGGVSFQFGD